LNGFEFNTRKKVSKKKSPVIRRSTFCLLAFTAAAAIASATEDAALAVALNSAPPVSTSYLGTYSRFTSNDTVSSSLINNNFDQLYLEMNSILASGILGTGSLTFTPAVNSNLYLTTLGTGSISLAPGGTGNISLTTYSSGNGSISLTASGSGNIVITPGATGNVGIGASSPASALQVAGPLATSVATYTSSQTLTNSNSIVFVNAGSGSVTITLPSASGITGRQYTIKRIDSIGFNGNTSSYSTPTSGYYATINVSGGGTIDSQSTLYLPNYGSYYTVVSDGTNWEIMSSYATPVAITTSGGSGSNTAWCPQGMIKTGGACNCTAAAASDGYYDGMGETYAYSCSLKDVSQCNSGTSYVQATVFCALQY
jgi:hypothetical protein